ncbi:MAG TPA: four helix bundle protein [Vicinamibacterales bacterium]|jgi:four helix bundle protein|nr:four helix bundle protein [Vicinamibacterales bacterium]
MGAKTYQELVFWQLSNELRQKIIAFTSREPAKSHRRFSDHIREAVSAACSNAAEGFGRRSHAEFAQYIAIARSSVMETQDKLLEALQSRFISQAEFDDMSRLADRAIGAGTKFLAYLEAGSQYPRKRGR